MSDTQIEIDIPCDVQDEDELGMPYALLSEARDPSRIVPGAIVITADEEDPVFARVHSPTPAGDTRWSTSSCCLVIHASTRTPFSGRISCPPERGLPRSGDPGRAVSRDPVDNEKVVTESSRDMAIGSDLALGPLRRTGPGATRATASRRPAGRMSVVPVRRSRRARSGERGSGARLAGAVGAPQEQ